MGRAADWKKQTDRKKEFLKMSPSTARGILIKKILFRFFGGDNNVFCFRCGEEITDLDFHLDHKEAWLHKENGIELYFSIENLALSHPLCNSVSRRLSSKRSVKDRVVNAVTTKRALFRRYWHRRKQLKKD